MGLLVPGLHHRVATSHFCTQSKAIDTNQVKTLYKQILMVGRDYPGGLNEVREKAKKQFFANKDLTDAAEIEKAYGRGEYVLSEMIALIQFHKYRAVNKRYKKDE